MEQGMFLFTHISNSSAKDFCWGRCPKASEASHQTQLVTKPKKCGIEACVVPPPPQLLLRPASGCWQAVVKPRNLVLIFLKMEVEVLLQSHDWDVTQKVTE